MAEAASITIIPLGTVDAAEVEASAKRVAKNLGVPVAIVPPAAMPVGHFEPGRHQSDARKVIGAVPPTKVAPPKPAPGTTADPRATKAATLTPMEAFGSRVHGAPPPPAPGQTAPKGVMAPI